MYPAVCQLPKLSVGVIVASLWYCLVLYISKSDKTPNQPKGAVWSTLFEPHCDKTNKRACAPSEDSNQPGHLPSLIRVVAVRLKKSRSLSYPLSTQRRLIRLGGCPGWSESSLGTYAILLVLSWCCSFAIPSASFYFDVLLYGKITLSKFWDSNLWDIQILR